MGSSLTEEDYNIQLTSKEMMEAFLYWFEGMDSITFEELKSKYAAEEDKELIYKEIFGAFKVIRGIE